MLVRNISRASTSHRITLSEWAALPRDVEGELVDGLLVEEEMPTRRHELVVAWLVATLLQWARSRRMRVFGSEHRLAVGPRRGRKPDVSVESPRAASNFGASLTTSPPRIVVEVISPKPRDTRRDRIEKADDYGRFGVRWYWLVDPGVRTIEIFELGSNHRYVRALSAAEGKIRPPGCRGLVLDLDDLWSYAGASDSAQE
jgi:Uma2 family endonuclease